MSFLSATGARTLTPRARLFLSRQHTSTLRSRHFHRSHQVQNVEVDYASKYASKLQEKAKKENATVDELRQKVKLQEQEARKARLASAAKHLAASASVDEPGTSTTTGTGAEAGTGVGAAKIPKRKDSSPVKPLSSILALPKLLQTPHTPAQINALWTAYHASRSGGTGRGYICASMPLETYERMLGVAAKWPSFILPLPREIPANVPTADGTTTTEKEKGHEFHYMQWATHDPPALPSADDSPFPPSTSPPALDPLLLGKQNPKTAMIIFTPLLEYKMRQTFATPYLVLTFYTDLAHTHGLVLLRGEITPSSSSNEKEWMLSQEDAQLLTMGLQRFYLWPVAAEGEGESKKETAAKEVLRRFHEEPERFDWEDVVRLAGDVGV